jgi:type IV pilus assembly protein PilP
MSKEIGIWFSCADFSLLQRTSIVALFLVSLSGGSLEAGPFNSPKQINPMRQDSIKLPAASDSPVDNRRTHEATAQEAIAQTPVLLSIPDDGIGTGYDPSGRRDPFAPVVQELQLGKVDANLPPLQRVTLTELNLVAIVWGAYGYTAMVQTPEGHGYTIRRGTKVGQNYGVVSAITERGVIVQERFTDVYGKKQEREYVKLLHPKEGSE